MAPEVDAGATRRVVGPGKPLHLVELLIADHHMMKWCEDHDIGYVLGLARNARLTRVLGAAMH